MAITFTMFILWYAGIPGVRWSFILAGLGADVMNYALKKIVGLEGER
jgi:hypothetical protein